MLSIVTKAVSKRAVVPRKAGAVRRSYALLHPPTFVKQAGEVTLYVKGFLARGESANDFREWFASHSLLCDSKRLNWQPNATAFRWQNGDLPIPLPLVSGALLGYKLLRLKSTVIKLTPAGLLASAGVDVALYAGMLATEYYKAEKSLDEQSLLLAENLLRLNAQHAKVRVVAHSLGCRLLHHAIQSIPPETRPHEVHLLAPAFVEDEVGPFLDSMAQNSVSVYHNQDDYILSLLYTGVTGGSQAVGCAGLQSKYNKVSTLDTSPYFSWLVHTEYRNKFHSFAL
jgi:hypothetical protein